jgi:hypothetical protein
MQNGTVSKIDPPSTSRYFYKNYISDNNNNYYFFPRSSSKYMLKLEYTTGNIVELNSYEFLNNSNVSGYIRPYIANDGSINILSIDTTNGSRLLKF